MRAIHLLIPAAAAALLFLAGPGLAHDHGERGEREHDDVVSVVTAASGSRPRAATPRLARRGPLPQGVRRLPPRLSGPGCCPPASWRRTMAGLERHFGQNAELDAETGASLEGWLVAGRRRGRRAGYGAA